MLQGVKRTSQVGLVSMSFLDPFFSSIMDFDLVNLKNDYT